MSEGFAIVPEVSASIPDWSREEKRTWQWDPSKSLLASIRSYQAWTGQRSIAAMLMRKAAIARHRFWSIITGAEIPVTTEIGGGLMIPHPNGIVIHPEVKIGPNCLVLQQVTLGQGRGGVPRLGGHVDVGAGAKILGPITLGDDARVGANALVTVDVPAGGYARNAPAEIIGGNSSPS